MNIKKSIPNLFTSLNLISGCLGLLAIYEGSLYLGALMILVGSFFDFFDGLLARVLNAGSEIGKQLDSLADMVTFGILPSFLLYYLLAEIGQPDLAYLALLTALASAFRLAKFNIDESQKRDFIGLPTPASAFLISGLVFVKEAEWEIFSVLYSNTYGLIFLIVALSYLLNSRIKFVSLKLNKWSLKGNELRFIIVISSIIIMAVFQLPGIFLIMLFYVLLSLLHNILIEKRVSWKRP